MSKSDMVERVARAICCPSGRCHIADMAEREGGKYISKIPCHAFSIGHQARAAIEAMRVPTDTMANAGLDACNNIPGTGVVPENVERMVDCWEAMITEALNAR